LAAAVPGSTGGDFPRFCVREEPAESIAIVPPEVVEQGVAGPFIVVVENREDFHRLLSHAPAGLEAIEVRHLLPDFEGWGPAAQGQGITPLDVIVSDPATEFSSLYRLVDVHLARPVRVTIPADKPGFRKALKLAAALRLSVRLLPGQPGPEAAAELLEAARFYLHDSMVEAPVEFFHSVLANFRGFETGNLWSILEQDPAIFSRRDHRGRPLRPADFVETRLAYLVETGSECAACPWRRVCAGYFKWPELSYDCTGVKRVFGFLQLAADEIAADLAAGEMLSTL
jgi:hypothetical protein